MFELMHKLVKAFFNALDSGNNNSKSKLTGYEQGSLTMPCSF